jgi:hypothetical protein
METKGQGQQSLDPGAVVGVRVTYTHSHACRWRGHTWTEAHYADANGVTALTIPLCAHLLVEVEHVGVESF